MRRPLRIVSCALLLALLAPLGTHAADQAPPSDLVDKAKREGQVNFYTAVDIAVAERVAKAFQEKYPGIKVNVERSGSERLFQRISQEYGSNIHNVDVINSSDAAHFLFWKKNGWLASFMPPDVARYYPANARDPQNTYAVWRATLSPIAYNARLVKPENVPKSFADLLKPEWQGKIVKGHPGYSGTIMTATAEIVTTPGLGWQFLEGLSKQRVMQVQSSTEPPKVLAKGERAVMADGNEYNVFELIDKGTPLGVVYPKEGTPLISSPAAIMKDAPHPNAARLLDWYLFSAEAQQLIVDFGGLRSFRFGIKEPASRAPITKIKLLKENPKLVEAQADQIKAHYSQLFGT